MFGFRNSLTLYTTANALILGFLASPSVVGWYGGAEKLLRALTSLSNPISQALYPRMITVVKRDRVRAARIVNRMLWSLVAIGLMQFVVLVVFAAPIVRVVLGQEFSPAAQILRVLAVVAPLSAFNGVLALQWIAPLDFETRFTLVVVAGAAVNLVMALILVPSLAGAGMAVAVVAAEIATALLTVQFLRSRSLLPWTDANLHPGRLN